MVCVGDLVRVVAKPLCPPCETKLPELRCVHCGGKLPADAHVLDDGRHALLCSTCGALHVQVATCRA